MTVSNKHPIEEYFFFNVFFLIGNSCKHYYIFYLEQNFFLQVYFTNPVAFTLYLLILFH